MGKYRVLGALLDRVFRNNLNANFDDVYTDIKAVDERVTGIVAQAGSSNTEIVDARGGKPILKDRLDAVDLQLAEKANQNEIWKKADLNPLNSRDYVNGKLLTSNTSYADQQVIALINQFNEGLIDYFISSVNPLASDTQDGKSKITPFATINPLKSLLASNPNALSGKRIAFERGGVYTPFDLYVINANDCVISAYGIGDRPYFDCTAPISGGWSQYSSGIWKVTLTRNADSKNFGNYFRNGIPIRKVESISSLTGKGDYVCYASGENTTTITLYMNSPVDPSTDGAEYRWSKYAMAVALQGDRNQIDGLWAKGNAAQDGAFKLGSNGGGGNVLSNCRLDWGSRHSALVGSGTLQSRAEFNEFYGGANDIETGGVLSNGTANSVVFNSVDHSTTSCVSRYNIYNGLSQPNYNTGGKRNFTGPYGHDSVQGRTMKRFESIGDTFVNMGSASSACGKTNLYDKTSHSNTGTFIELTSSNLSIEITNTVENSTIDCLFYNIDKTNITFKYHDNGLVNIIDCGGGSAGFIRAGEGSTAISNMDFENNKFNINGIRLSNVNKFFLRNRAGSLRWVNNIISPNVAPPVDYIFDLSIGSGVVTLSPDNGKNSYPIGSNFRLAGTVYRGLNSWVGASGEVNSALLPMPKSEMSDDFDGVDANLDSVWFWNRLNGVAGDLQRKGNLLYGNVTSGTPTVYTRGDVLSTSRFAKFKNKNIASAGGVAMAVIDASNLLYIRASSTAYQIMTVISGTVSQALTTSGITPSLDDDVVLVLRKYNDPYDGTTSLRVWIIVNGGSGSVLQSINNLFIDELTCGVAARSVVTNYADDLSFGSAPLTA